MVTLSCPVEMFAWCLFIRFVENFLTLCTIIAWCAHQRDYPEYGPHATQIPSPIESTILFIHGVLHMKYTLQLPTTTVLTVYMPQLRRRCARSYCHANDYLTKTRPRAQTKPSHVVLYRQHVRVSPHTA